MIVIPAIDLKAGSASGLRQGRMEDDTVYSARPRRRGPPMGRRGGAPASTRGSGRRVRREAREPRRHPRHPQGGGRRNGTGRRHPRRGDRRAAPGRGDRLRDPRHRGAGESELVGTCSRRNIPARILVGIDARGGMVAVRGWADVSKVTPATVGASASPMRGRRASSSPTSSGTECRQVSTSRPPPNFAARPPRTGHRLRRRHEPRRHPAPAGRREADGITGVITGRAIYEGTLDLAEAMRARRGSEENRPCSPDGSSPAWTSTPGAWSRAPTSSICATRATPWRPPALYDAQGADELTFLDITASHDERDIIIDVVRGHGRAASSCPDRRAAACARWTTSAGSCWPAPTRSPSTPPPSHRPEFVEEASRRFGSQCIVVAIDAKRRGRRRPGGWEVYTHGGRQPTGIDAVEWARRMEADRRGGDPADQHGRRRHQGRLRPRADPRRRRRGGDPGHRLRGARATPSTSTRPSPRAGPTRRWPPPSSTSGRSRWARSSGYLAERGVPVRL